MTDGERGMAVPDRETGKVSRQAAREARRIPLAALVPGAAGLLPPFIALVVRLSAGSEPDTPLPALLTILALSYSAMVLSFLGGIWWGIAATRLPADRNARLLTIAVLPTIVAIVLLGLSGWHPRIAAVVQGIAIIGTLLVDRELYNRDLTPRWWLRLRVPLSFALGLMTIALGLML